MQKQWLKFCCAAILGLALSCAATPAGGANRPGHVSLPGHASLRLTPAAAFSQQAPRPDDSAALDRSVAEAVREKGLVGASVAVARDGKLILAKGYGKSSLASGAAVTPETPFAIGSITKQFTSACVLLLAERGKLSVEDKVAKYFPTLTDASRITLLDLMNHVSGYPDYYPLDFVDRRMLEPIGIDRLIHDYATQPLDFAPGTRWSYSNTGFIILGRVVEKVSGEPFGVFLRRNILEPLGLTHTFFLPKAGTAGLAEGYTSFALAAPEPAHPEAKGWIYSAGGLYSTPSDLVKWDMALVSGRVLAPKWYLLMTTARRLADGRTTRYGCGIGVGTAPDGETILQHGGAVSGFVASNLIVPGTRSAVVVLLNSEGSAGMRAIESLLVPAVLPERRNVPKVSGPPAAEAARTFFAGLQKGEVDRSRLGAEYNWFLTAERVKEAARALAPLGAPTAVQVRSLGERGGMETSAIVFTFGKTKVMVDMFRSTDGKIQQFLLWKQ
jgi:D-alanyl-D-alanine carboxypeptidase